MDHFDLGRIHAEDFMRYLGEGGFQPLPVGMHADPDFQAAARTHADRGLLETRNHRHAPGGVNRRSVGGLLTEDGKTHAEQAPV